MITIGAYVPSINQTVQIPLKLRQGFTEVINDTNFALTVSTGAGQCLQPPNVAQIYPTPPGGGTFSIGTFFLQFNQGDGTTTTLPGDQYLTGDVGPADQITINQYEDESELQGRSYPYTLVRSNLPLANVNNIIQVSSQGTLSSTLSASIASQGTSGSATNPLAILLGIDVSVDQESTAHSYTLTYGPFIGGGNFEVVFHSTTNGTFLYSKDFEAGLPGVFGQGVGSSSTITATIAAVSGATARGSINLWGYAQ